MESKFELLVCTETQKTLFATHQLRGAAASWWATYLAMQPTGRQVPWAEFSAAFRAHHIPSSVMKFELREFIALKQGNKSIREYVQVFNELALYASQHVDTDAKKKECFLEGMTPKLRSRSGLRFENFNQLVDDAIAMEEDLRLHHLEKKKAKVTAGPSGSAPPRPKLTYQAPSRPPHQQQLVVRPVQQQNIQRPQTYRPPQPQWNAQAPAPPQVWRRQGPCFHCGKPGHFARYCKKRPRRTQRQVPTQVNQKTKRTTKLGHVNHLQIFLSSHGRTSHGGYVSRPWLPCHPTFNLGPSHTLSVHPLKSSIT